MLFAIADRTSRKTSHCPALQSFATRQITSSASADEDNRVNLKRSLPSTEVSPINTPIGHRLESISLSSISRAGDQINTKTSELSKTKGNHSGFKAIKTIEFPKLKSANNLDGEAKSSNSGSHLMTQALSSISRYGISKPSNIGKHASQSQFNAFASDWNSLGEGKSLTQQTRSPFEQSYSRDFSPVRIHTDSKASRLADASGSKAFTVGNRIIFNTGAYQPRTSMGQFIIGHELAHMVQKENNHSTGQEISHLKASLPNSPAEREASHASMAALNGMSFSPTTSDEADIMTFPWLLLGAALLIGGGIAAVAPSTEENRVAAERDRDRLIILQAVPT